MSSLELCPNCGNQAEYHHVYPIDEDLTKSWEISPKYAAIFNEREGLICIHCGVNKRAQALAVAILKSKFGFGAENLVSWVRLANKHKLRVCELNSCHELHKTLIGLKYLTYAEYGTESEQNIEKLTYKDSTFDLVLHSETLEHVNQPDAAMDECRRVLKDTGLVLFTTPVIWSRRTRRRAEIVNGKIQKILPASYHGYRTDDYLVFFEYGADISKLLRARIFYAEPRYQAYAFGCGKRGAFITSPRKAYYKLAEKRALDRVG